MSQVEEFFLIEKYFQNIGSKFLSKKNFILGSGDDSAVLRAHMIFVTLLIKIMKEFIFLNLYLLNL